MALAQLCDISDSQAATLSLGELADQCLQLATLVDPGVNAWLLWVSLPAALVSFAGVLIHRLTTGVNAGIAFAEAGEGAVYGAVAGFAGVAGGLFFALVFPAWFMGLLFGGIAVAGLLFAIAAVIRGDAAGHWKLLGFVLFLVLSALLATMAIACFAAPGDSGIQDDFHRYLFACGVGLGITSALNGMIASIQRGNLYGIGVVTLAINGSWGFLGNLTGLMMHFASMFCYRDFGKRHAGSDRMFFVCYERGFSLKSNAAGRFAFTQGAVMSAHTPDLRFHEGVHVVQHYLFGPIYLLSYFLWTALLVVAGAIAGAASGVGVGEGITRLSYYNNPWEVMAYGIANKTGRPVHQPLMWAWGWAWLVAVLYILLTSAGFVAWMVYLLGN